MARYSFVTALHGDEYMPVLALASQGIEQVVGNIKGLAARKRFVETDLNAAFGKEGKKYEETRARNILKLLDPDKKVVDFHTFTAPSPAFCVLVDLKMLPLARKTGVKRVVYMKHNIKKGGALINHRDGVSVEVGQHHDPKSFERTLGVMESLRTGKEVEVEVYEVYGEIKQKGKYKNFERHERGFYPILSGGKAYKNYGLKAKLIK